MSKIVAFVDGSIYSQSVCDHAAWAAKRMSADVDVIHVLGRREAGPQDLSGNIGLGARTKLIEDLAKLDEERAILAQKRGRAILEDAEEIISKQGITVTTKLRNGDLLEELQGLTHDANLAIIGKRGEAADFAQMHLGSNLERVVRACTIPIMVTSRAFRPIDKFLIAFDGGTSALKAVDHVVRSEIFRDLQAQIITVGDDTPETKRKIEGAAALLKGAGFAASTKIVNGQPDTVIAERIKDGDADMLVMGAYGHSRIRSLIIGSTTTQMIRSCQVPLLLFR
ncbi:universal stress protein [Parasulfitobacter algicola]|uniref:Universal stress protein n=1 Tax=Parasulfitobacter algicola TaxID=2614809 RepID=A0ABX2IVA0_9RHOB|nr:universal stress protein [Sulfitobacter algicola]NSX56851.1 universal stress protein [Sulfitobacter algicola]